jgi:hypothetical protein
MPLSPELADILKIGSGIFWTLVYLLIIKHGFQDRTCGMPLPALAANLAWEFTFSFLLPPGAPAIYIFAVWLALDLVILVQLLRFGKNALTNVLPGNWFYLAILLALVMAFGAVLTMTFEFHDWDGIYSVFGINLMMSILFVVMLLQRKDIAGQSIYIAIFKMIGTLLPSILFFVRYPGSPLLNFLYVTIFIFDWLYIFLLYAKHRELGINPWTRL